MIIICYLSFYQSTPLTSLMTNTWTELHRPKKLSEIAHQPQVVQSLETFLKSNDIPNLLFFGPQGTGKTTAIHAFARELFGDQYRQRIFEINASSERGVNSIRTRVKPLSQLSLSSGIRLIILEEADALTRDAQAALRRILEDSAATTRVCLLCNYASQIIAPLASRCAKFRFFPLPQSVISQNLLKIAKLQATQIDEIAADQISENARGDMRKAVTDLQMHSLIGRGIVDLQTCRLIEKVQGGVDNQILNQLFDAIIDKNVAEIEFKEIVNRIFESQISPQELVFALFDKFLNSEEISDRFRQVCAEQYCKFGVVCAKRGTEKLALSKFLYGVRCACFK
ncbi:Replication factor C, subunit 4 [Spironucleus salmonicida]|uniref:Replication factor C, subunit 4 n=1 Tax=Spironucleus salmonicida TaxID=348837 RepID=V6LWX9_9EUKA|nr:Replication factor C, subunit 4 [Spironucleus salmonicida]|eukprot:EST48206.1 Replication factor C, subunit 4 [Spironucleus salmonicida]